MTFTSHMNQHHHNTMRRWTWAHVQQGLRRNCLIGPVAFCLLVVLTAPYVLQDPQLFQSLPLVEAVPFIRKEMARRAMAFRRNAAVRLEDVVSVSGGATSSSALGMGAAAAVAEPQTAVEVVEEEVEEAKAQPVVVPAPAPTVAAAPVKGKKRSRDETLTDYNFPLFAGHDTFADDKDAPVPFRYMEAHQHNLDNARKAVLASLEWRQDHKIDTILSRPHPNFDVAKRVLPHYLAGRSAVSNHVVFVQRPGLVELPLGDHNGLELQDMLDQYAYVFEYCWNVLHTNTQSTKEGDKDLMIGIMDLQGLSLSVLRNRDLINFVKRFVGMIDAHYPTRAYKTIMVNAPTWFSTAYKLVSPIMRETTKEKIVIFSAGKQQKQALEASLGKEMADLMETALRVPDKKERKAKDKNDLSLTSDVLLETEMEQEMRAFVMRRLEAEGLEMKKIKAMDQ